MPWLLDDDRVLATLEIADGHRSRARGLIGRDGIEGAVLLVPARCIHTFGMRFPLDVAWCDRDMTVLRVERVPPNRLPRPCLRSHSVIEAEAGAFARWGLAVGTGLEVRR